MADELESCAGGDAAACASALYEFYKLIEKNQEEGVYENIPPKEFTCGDAGLCQGGCGYYTVKTIGGPGGEVIIQIFAKGNSEGGIYEDGEMVGWADTGWRL